jgi:hypothetical protein
MSVYLEFESDVLKYLIDILLNKYNAESRNCIAYSASPTNEHLVT